MRNLPTIMRIQKSKLKSMIIFCSFGFEDRSGGGGGARSAPAPRMPFQAPAHEARRSSRVQPKSTNTAEAHDSEQKAPDMQHKTPNKKVLAQAGWPEFLIRSRVDIFENPSHFWANRSKNGSQMSPRALGTSHGGFSAAPIQPSQQEGPLY